MSSYTAPALNQSAIKRIKRAAKLKALQEGMSYNQALDALAQPLGHRNWSTLARNLPTSAVLLTQPMHASMAPAQTMTDTWMTVTTISELYATTIPKVRAALKKAAYLQADGKPSPLARSLNLVQEHTIEDQYGISTGMAIYYKWSNSVAKALFPTPNAVDQWCHVANRFEADRRMQQTFARAAKAMGLIFDPNAEDQPNTTHPGLHPRAYLALLDAHHGAMDFLGSSLSFFATRGKKDVKKLEFQLHPIVANIVDVLAPIDASEAQFFEQACASLLQWLGKQRR